MKRLKVKLAIFLALGAIVNIGVAWFGNLEWTRTAGAWNATHSAGGLFTGNDEYLDFMRTDTWLFEQLDWSAGLPHSKLAMPRVVRAQRPPAWSIVPKLAGYQRPGVAGHQTLLQHREVGTGIPMVSMVWCGRQVMWQSIPFTSAIRLKDRVYNDGWSQKSIPRVLPLRVSWPGFAVNTLYWALILWMLWLAPGLPRRWRRRRRIKNAQCPACGYPCGTSQVCTECGEALTCRVG